MAVAMARSSSAAGSYTRLQMDSDRPHTGPEFSLPAPPAPIDKFGRPQSQGATTTENHGANHGANHGLSPAHIPPPGSEPGSRHRGPRSVPYPPVEEQTLVTFDRDPPGPPGASDKNNRCCDNKYWCIRDCCGMVCVFFTWGLIFYAEFVVLRVILLPEIASVYSVLNFIIFQAFAGLAIASHTRTMLTDPGAVPRGNATKENIEKMGLQPGEVIFKCPKCCCIKPERAHHCSVCQRCVRKMDHHCPWVNNCVGENNQKFFVLFTLYIALMSVHALFLAINHFLSCIGKDWHECRSFSPPATIVFLLFLIFEGLLFALFTSIMFGTQVSAIWYDETGIESLKKVEASWVRKSRWKSMQAVFGRFSIHWFSPFTADRQSTQGKGHGYLFSV